MKSVTKRWGDFVGVRDLDLTVEEAEFLVLLGPSGCGKTTTMRMVAGLEAPSAGEIWIGDDLVNDMPPRERDIAMVFQNYGLYPHMSVRDNIGYPLKVRGVPRAEAARLVEASAARVELGPYLERKPSQLSGGQRQRVALARSLVRRPRVFLMDEPLSNLDAKLRVVMRAELKHLHHELKVTTIYVTHDQMEAMTLATRIAVMNKGVIQQLATPETIYNDPANLFVADFIGSPSMNLLPGLVEDGLFRAGDLTLSGLAIAGRRDIVLGVRPEDAEIVGAGEGVLTAPVYAFELTGDSVLVTLETGARKIAARADRHFRCDIGQPVGLAVNRDRLYLFDAATEQRIRL
ncbi:MAG: ABC transporter ATP-binding protein [Methylobacteriaceae bacterium]|nr:ABC transporter ATP-binding protein [Methylobacteriaceae bacterium]